MLTEIDKLVLCIQDAQMILDMKTEEDLFRFFENSKTKIAEVFEESVEQVLNNWEPGTDRIDQIRKYLLAEYIAYNISEIFKDYEFLREMTEEQIRKTK